MPLSRHPVLPYASTFFGFIFFGFGTTYMLYPRTGYELFGFSGSPTTPAEWALMERVMVLYGAKDLFIAAAIFSSTWFGSRKSAGLILLSAAACAGVDGYVVKSEAKANEWNHWGYGLGVAVLGAMMTGALG